MAKISKTSKTNSDVMKEISDLASSLSGAVKGLAKNPELRRAAQEAMDDVLTAGKNLKAALENTKKDPNVKDVQKRAKKILEAGRAQGEAALGAYRDRLVKGLEGLSKGLSDAAGKIKKK